MVLNLMTSTKDSGHEVEDLLRGEQFLITSCSCPDSWTWNWNDRSPEADISSNCVKEHSQERATSDILHRTVIFHPYWSNGTAAVRGTLPLNAFTVHYWEVGLSLYINIYSTFIFYSSQAALITNLSAQTTLELSV